MPSYPDAINLPFNGQVIREHFTPVRPGDAPRGGDASWIILQKSALVVRKSAEGVELPFGASLPFIPGGTPERPIGVWRGRDLRVAELPPDLPLPEGYSREPFNAAGDVLDDTLLTLGGLGQQILWWDGQSRLCSRCGGETAWLPGTWGKRCPSCGYEHFPHIYPCAIVLVKRGDEFLLTRKASWPAGRYSLVAGFLDIGESLEECVHREVEEETGIRVTNVRYVGSQSWPFPSQLMAGFVADYAGGDLRVDYGELDDAGWFSPDRMPAALPPRRSIARWIFDTYSGVAAR